MPAWFVQLLIGVALNIVAYLLAPKPKVSQPTEVQDLEDPTAEAGRPVPKVFGSMRVQAGNLLWYGEKATIQRTMQKRSSKK